VGKYMNTGISTRLVAGASSRSRHVTDGPGIGEPEVVDPGYRHG
jgi:hypothetical protein